MSSANSQMMLSEDLGALQHVKSEASLRKGVKKRPVFVVFYYEGGGGAM